MSVAVWRSRRSGARRERPGPRTDAGDTSADGAERPPPRASGQGPSNVIDLTDSGGGWAARIESDPVRAAELAERFRARKARDEAERDLRRLRARHWSGERLVEEARSDAEWWAHYEADPYAVLGLLPGARLEEAASARRRIAKECHPDRLDCTDAEREEARQRMIAANAAYDRLRRALLRI